MNRSIRIVFVFLIGIVTPGCALLEGRPKSPIKIDSVTRKLEAKLDKFDDIDANTVTERNAAINEVLIVIDFRYSEFINNAGLEHRVKSMTTDFILLSLNLTGTAVGGAGIKTLLAALSAGVAGTNMAFDKTFIYETTVPALIMQMNADRTEKRRQILDGMNQEIIAYSWAQAVRDLIDYYNVGTLQNAINSIKKNAGSKQVNEEKAIERIVMLRKATPDNVIAKYLLSRSLNQIDTMNDVQLNKVKEILEPLSVALNYLPECKNLSSQSGKLVTKDKVKDALQDCIRDVGEGGGRIDNDLAILEGKFKEAELKLIKTDETEKDSKKP